ncbi:MarC family protein [Megalodesulfovibrio paquesii]
MELRGLFELAVPLFLIMDGLGNVPVCMSMLRRFPPRRQQRIIFRELCFALAISILFCFFGDWLLKFLGLGPSTLRLAGGVVLFVISMRMVFPDERKESEEPEEPEALTAEEPFIVPIAVPMLAGPSLLAAVMLYATLDSGPVLTALAFTVAWLPTTAILLLAPWLSRKLGARGLRAVERLMGLILILLAIQMVEDGVRLFLSKQ